jgi:hypothetical protein
MGGDSKTARSLARTTDRSCNPPTPKRREASASEGMNPLTSALESQGKTAMVKTAVGPGFKSQSRRFGVVVAQSGRVLQNGYPSRPSRADRGRLRLAKWSRTPRQPTAALALLALALTACQTPTEPKVQIREVQVPIRQACVPTETPQPPASYPDDTQPKGPEHLAERLRNIAAANELRRGRLAILEPVIKACR